MFNVPQKAEEEAQKAKEEEEKRKKKEEERARRRARGLEDEEEQEQEEGKTEGEEDEEEEKEGEETEEEQHREPGEIIKGFYYGKSDKFWVSMVSFSLLLVLRRMVLRCCDRCSRFSSAIFEMYVAVNEVPFV